MPKNDLEHCERCGQQHEKQEITYQCSSCGTILCDAQVLQEQGSASLAHLRYETYESSVSGKPTKLRKGCGPVIPMTEEARLLSELGKGKKKDDSSLEREQEGPTEKGEPDE